MSGSMGTQQLHTKSGQWENQVSIALHIAIEARCISVFCEHGTPIDLQISEPAYELANIKFNAKELPQFSSLEEVEAAMREVFDNAGDVCPECQTHVVP